MLRRLLLPTLLGATLAGAVPQSFPWQGALRNDAGKPLVSTTVTLRFQIKQADTVAYSETHGATTGPTGLVHASIGKGTPTKGSFSDVVWTLGTQSLAVAFDPAGGQDFKDLGESPLQSVPFALVSGTAESGGTKGREIVSAFVEGRSLVLKYSDGKSDDVGAVRDTIPPGMLERVGDTLRLKTAGVADGQVLRLRKGQWVADSIRTAALATGPVGGNQPLSIRNPFLGMNYIIATQGIFPSRSGADPFIAEITMFGGNFAPRGYAFCNGAILSIAQNTALFSLLGTTFGGNGQTTFALPDLRGRVPVQQGQGPGLSVVDLGEVGGVESTSILISNLPSHSHSIPSN
jgi:microcystin-dependent protein